MFDKDYRTEPLETIRHFDGTITVELRGNIDRIARRDAQVMRHAVRLAMVHLDATLLAS
jgi:hypothetical protein